MLRRVARMLLLCALLLACACAPAQLPQGAGPGTVQPTASPQCPASTPVQTVPSPQPATPTPWKPAYDPLRLPDYAVAFLGDSLSDYQALIRAILAGEPFVTLENPSSFPKLERTMNALFPQKALLYDARYTLGEGPLAYDAETRTVSIRYAYDTETHRLLMAAYAARMEDALSRCTAGMTARQQAVALYLWVIDNLHYELDMQLTVYDAVTTGAAYCQTYSMLFQQLLTQVGIASYQVGGSVDTDGDGVADAEHQWNRLLLDGAWYYADPTWDTGDLRYFGLSYDECLLSGYLEPFVDPCDALLG